MSIQRGRYVPFKSQVKGVITIIASDSENDYELVDDDATAKTSSGEDSPGASSSTGTVYVYAGEGAGRRSVLSTLEALSASLKGVQTKTLTAEELLDGGWRRDCALICFPGGADLPYCRALNGRGNELIQAYVRSGGAYLGLCAGAYYACSGLEFELGTALEVKGPRELAFYPGLAIGARYPGFEYKTEAGARAAPLQFKGPAGWTQCRDYSNGGASFSECHESAAVTVLATYTDGGQEAAAVRCQVGAGAAVLCGTHPELAPRWLDAACDATLVQAAHPERPASDVNRLASIAQQTKQSLEEDASARQQFWELLLAACGQTI